MPARLFPLSTFSSGLTVLAGMGINLDQITDKIGIAPGLIGDPQALITARQYHELAALGQRMMRDRAFALNVADWVRLDMVDVLGPLFATCETVRSYLLTAARFIPLISPCFDTRLEEDGSEARYFCIIATDQGVDDRFFHAEACYATGQKLLDSVFRQQPFRPRRLELQHDGSAWLDQYHRRFGTAVEVVFNAPDNVAIYDRAVLDIRNPGYSPSVHAQMERLALARLATLPNVDTVATQVIRLLEQEAGRRILDLDDVAGALGMTARTLQRRLMPDTFQKLRDGVRYRQAQALLRNPACDVATIAATLGFSEPATFHRAFRGWSGLSPTEFRRRHCGSE